MEISSIITAAVNAAIQGVATSSKALEGKADIEYPTRVEIEFGITSTFTVASYDDVPVARVRIAVPMFVKEDPEPQSGSKKKPKA